MTTVTADFAARLEAWIDTYCLAPELIVLDHEPMTREIWETLTPNEQAFYPEFLGKEKEDESCH